MSYGGVDSGQKMFTGGLDAKTLEQSNAAEIAEITATNYISDDKQEGDDSDFVVDFDGVLKGFLQANPYLTLPYRITGPPQLTLLDPLVCPNPSTSPLLPTRSPT